MDRSKLRFRFEQRRGHYLVAEGLGERLLTRKDCDDFQLRMLMTCNIPGLLKLEIEELDGCLALRYALNGVKMLSQAMRTSQWTMAAYMNAVCRLAEVLEDCRLYVLHTDRILLEDDRIFIGEAGEFDLRFVYLPFPLNEGKLASSLELLLIRWMMYVKEPDGQAIQQMLRLISSPSFKPSDLSRFARQYGAQEAASTLSTTENTSSHAFPTAIPIERDHPQDEVAPATIDEPDSASDASRWRWFQPSPADAHGMSALLGDDPEAGGVVPQSPQPVPVDRGRERIWLLCAAAGLTAIAWRYGYAAMPDSGGLAVSIVATLAVAIGSAGVYIIRSRHHARASRSVMEAEPGDNHQRALGAERPIQPVAARRRDQTNRHQSPVADRLKDESLAQPESNLEDTNRSVNWREENSTASTNDNVKQASALAIRETDRTQYLEPASRQQDTAVYYLIWESEPQASVIPLQGLSLVIGRSREASGHLDVTPGISRAHLELLRTEEGWTATDLGSRNGSKLNGTEMAAYESYVLQPEDSLELAGSVYRFKFGKLQQHAS